MRDQNYWDMLNMFAIVLQMADLYLLENDLSNNDLMRKLQKQEREYLQKIIKQNDCILEKLSEKYPRL